MGARDETATRPGPVGSEGVRSRRARAPNFKRHGTKVLDHSGRLPESVSAAGLSQEAIDWRCSIEGIGLCESGRGFLTKVQPGIDVPCKPFDDEDSLLRVYSKKAPDRVEAARGLIQRTRGCLAPLPDRDGFWIRSGIYQLTEGNPEYVIHVGDDFMAILDPATRPVVHGMVAGVRCVSISCLVREVPGFNAFVDLLLDDIDAEGFVREFTVGVARLTPAEIASGHGGRRFTMAAMVHVLATLQRYRVKAPAVVDEVQCILERFQEAQPFTRPGDFAFAMNDTQRLHGDRDPAWSRAAAVAPFWSRDGERCDVLTTFAVPEEDTDALRGRLADLVLRDGFVAADKMSVGLFPIVDDGRRLVSGQGFEIELRMFEGKLLVEVAALFDLGGIDCSAAEIEAEVEKLRGSKVPQAAFRRSGVDLASVGLVGNKWWIDVCYAAELFASAGGERPGARLHEFFSEVERRSLPALRRDNGGLLPQVSEEGNAVLGLQVCDRLLPLLVEDDGSFLLTQAQVASVAGCDPQAVIEAAANKGLVEGTPGVSIRQALVADAVSREQVHFNGAATLTLAVVLKSHQLFKAVRAVTYYIGEDLGAAGSSWRKTVLARKISALKRLPTLMRTIPID